MQGISYEQILIKRHDPQPQIFSQEETDAVDDAIKKQIPIGTKLGSIWLVCKRCGEVTNNMNCYCPHCGQRIKEDVKRQINIKEMIK